MFNVTSGTLRIRDSTAIIKVGGNAVAIQAPIVEYHSHDRFPWRMTTKTLLCKEGVLGGNRPWHKHPMFSKRICEDSASEHRNHSNNGNRRFRHVSGLELIGCQQT